MIAILYIASACCHIKAFSDVFYFYANFFCNAFNLRVQAFNLDLFPDGYFVKRATASDNSLIVALLNTEVKLQSVAGREHRECTVEW